MSEKRFKIYQDSIRKFESDRIWGVKSETNSLEPYMTFKEAEKCCDLLNEQQELIEELRLQEKEKGVPVFVVRDGKNPVALFFNEQRAMYYCQENMAHLTYQQEKWCRVE